MAESTIKTSNTYISGTDAIWKYHKFSDGTYHAWYEGTISLYDCKPYGGLWFMKHTSALNPPSFSTLMTSFVGASNGSIIFAYLGYDSNNSSYWLCGTNYGTSIINDFAVRFDMYGRWD